MLKQMLEQMLNSLLVMSILKICQYTCEHSVKRLVRLNQIGEYGSQRLLDILGNHLDFTYANADIWKEFASCLLQILSEEDRLSFNEGENKHEDGNNMKTSRQIPARFTKVRNWTARYRYWLKRHFSKDMLAAEIH
ncbi:hypothetical protein Droror1_Dr00014152 [Drosera rotundifolia]